MKKPGFTNPQLAYLLSYQLARKPQIWRRRGCSEVLGLQVPRGFPPPSGGRQSMLDHSPANALGGLASAKKIAGRRADLEGGEAAH